MNKNEILKIFGKTPLDIDGHEVKREVFDTVSKRFQSHDFGIEAVYLMGVVCGKRAERKRRKGDQQCLNTP